MLFGWGRGFNGGYGNGNGGGAVDNYVLASDFATIQRQLSDGFSDVTTQTRFIQNGLCDGFYAQAQMVNGVNMNIMQNGYETRNAINTLGYNLQDCCCKIGTAIQGVNYNMAMNSNAIQNTMCNNTRDIIENANANYRAIHDELVANKIEAKNDIIAQQQSQIQALQLKASQEAQNAYLLSELKACPRPAYVVQPPQSVSFPTNCYGTANFNGGCNGGCNGSIQ